MKGIRFLKGTTVVKVFLGADCVVKARDAHLVEGLDYDTIEQLQGGSFDTWVHVNPKKKIGLRS